MYDIDACLTLKKMDDAEFKSKKDRSNAPGIVWKTKSEYTLEDKLEEGNGMKRKEPN